jgi:hypothetical protein
VSQIDGAEPRYAAWLPGPWIDLTEYVDGAEPDEFRARCEVCGSEVAIGVDADDDHPRVADAARRDWERHVAADGPAEVRCFLLRGVGPGKSLRIGHWADVVRAIPYLFFAGDPVPPLAVLNAVLSGTDGDAGMSGGVEWPRHQLTSDEYERVRRDLITFAQLLDVEAPVWVSSRQDFRTWTIVARFGCSREAAAGWLAAIREAGGGDELTRLHQDEEAWLAAFDERGGRAP